MYEFVFDFKLTGWDGQQGEVPGERIFISIIYQLFPLLAKDCLI